jgi:hypothetical protein
MSVTTLTSCPAATCTRPITSICHSSIDLPRSPAAVALSPALTRARADDADQRPKHARPAGALPLQLSGIRYGPTQCSRLIVTPGIGHGAHVVLARPRRPVRPPSQPTPIRIPGQPAVHLLPRQSVPACHFRHPALHGSKSSSAARVLLFHHIRAGGTHPGPASPTWLMSATIRG